MFIDVYRSESVSTVAIKLASSLTFVFVSEFLVDLHLLSRQHCGEFAL